jgi:two-component system C4-dicarboxylate transport response regulator DctD
MSCAAARDEGPPSSFIAPPPIPKAHELPAILNVEDQAVSGKSLARFLPGAGYDCTLKSRAEEGLRTMQEVSLHVAHPDVRLPGTAGLQALRDFQQQDADLPVIMSTETGTIETAVEAMGTGAADYLCRPLDLQEVRLVLE